MKYMFNYFIIRQILFAVLLLIPLISVGQIKKKKNKKLTQEKEQVIHKTDSSGATSIAMDSAAPNMTYENRLEAMISKYGKNKGRMIADGKVWTSISFEMAVDSWGEPQKIQKSEISMGSTEKWIYPDDKYLFFKNGRLQSWRK